MTNQTTYRQKMRNDEEEIERQEEEIVKIQGEI